jgi:hypothetical protein
MIDTTTSPEGIAICEECYGKAQMMSDEELGRQRSKTAES